MYANQRAHYTWSHTLLSDRNFSVADYISIYDGDKVNIYDGYITRIKVSEKEVLKGWRFPTTNLWWIPLMGKVTNLNEYTLVLTSKYAQQSLNYLYTVPTTNHILYHVQTIMKSNWPSESINNIYKFLSIKPFIRYLHADAGFPTKSTCLMAIHRGNYLSWPLVTVKI